MVFAFLALLAVLMVLIRGVDRFGRDPAGSPPRGRAPGTPPALPVWAVAAVAAYLAEERAVDRASASAWTRRPDR